MKKNRKLIVLSHMYPKGYQPYSGIFVQELVRAISEVGLYEIVIISPIPFVPKLLTRLKRWGKYYNQPAEMKGNGITHFYPRYFALPGRLFFPFQTITMFLSLMWLFRKNPDLTSGTTLLHSHALLPDGLAGHMIASHFKIRHVCTLHGSDINIYPYFSSLSYKMAKIGLSQIPTFIAVSKKIAERAKDIHQDVKVHTIYNGVNNQIFHPHDKLSCRRLLGLEPQLKYVLFIGNLFEVKGVDLLLEAFAILRADDVRLVIVGSGLERFKLERLAGSLKINAKTSFVGQVPHEKVPLWLAAADVLAMPSRNEGFPTIIPEAMSCGIPIVAADVGGVAEAIKHEKTGLLVPPENVIVLADAISRALNDDALRTAITSGAANYVTGLTWENIASQNLSVYEEVLQCQ
jgi:glycosyltransferase involved in cell wall biosynthesis